MSLVMDDLVKGITDALKARDKKTSALDTTATVKRVDRSKGIAWVHFPGGVDETPVKLTVDAKEGDTVQVRSSKGRAWITGNATAPPTDDKEAKRAGHYAGAAYKAASSAQDSADKAQKSADEAMSATESLAEDVSTLSDDVDDIEGMIGDGDESGIEIKTQYYLSTSNATQQGGQWVDSLPTYVSGRYYWTRTVTIYADGSEVEGTPTLDVTNQIAAEVKAVATATDQHFWHDSTGAYVTRSDKNLNSGYAMKFTNQGILQTYNGKNLMALTGSGLSLYQSDGSTLMAAYSSGGAYLYADGDIQASFTTSGVTIGNDSGTSASATVSSSGFSIRMYNSFTGRRFTAFTVGLNGNTPEITGISNAPLRFASGIYVNNTAGISSQYDITANGTISGSSLNITNGGTIKGGATINGGATITGGLNASGDVTVGKLYVSTPGTAESKTANCRIATGENNRIMFTGGSSRRVKHDIKPIGEKCLDPHKLYDADVIQFIYNLDYLNDKDERYNVPVIGFIAEDLQKVYPIAVDTENGKAVDWNYRYIIPPMLALIQDQKKEIDHLTNRVKMLEERSA